MSNTLQFPISQLPVQSDQYPKLLAQIHKPPLLYMRGVPCWQNKALVAIVGSRKASSYGLRVATQLGRELAQHGVVVVSGLALGIDAAAHRACVDAGGQTIAVLGNGLNEIYPVRNTHLGQRILETNGAILSEFTPDTPALPYNFPQRNRIIAGLSHITIIIEANEKSGALITAQHALDWNREVLSVPGSIYSPTSAGCNRLIKEGAGIVRNVQDILELLEPQQLRIDDTTALTLELTSHEQQVLSCLTQEPTHIDKLTQSARLDISLLNTALTELEIKGVIARDANNQYYKT